MKDYAQALIAAVLIVCTVLWCVRVFFEVLYG